MCLTLADLFVAGLALDLVGAIALARGLLASPAVLAVRSTGFWGTDNPLVTAGLARDRADGLVGVAALSVGFVVQIIGYVLTLAHEPTVTASWGKAFVALAVGIIVGAIGWVIAAQLGDWVTKRTLVAMASYRIKRADEPPQRVPYPSPPPLLDWGKASGWAARADEDAESYARRVFGVDRFTPGGPNDDPPADAPSG